MKFLKKMFESMGVKFHVSSNGEVESDDAGMFERAYLKYTGITDSTNLKIYQNDMVCLRGEPVSRFTNQNGKEFEVATLVPVTLRDGNWYLEPYTFSEYPSHQGEKNWVLKVYEKYCTHPFTVKVIKDDQGKEKLLLPFTKEIAKEVVNKVLDHDWSIDCCNIHYPTSSGSSGGNFGDGGNSINASSMAFTSQCMMNSTIHSS